MKSWQKWCEWSKSKSFKWLSSHTVTNLWSWPYHFPAQPSQPTPTTTLSQSPLFQAIQAPPWFHLTLLPILACPSHLTSPWSVQTWLLMTRCLTGPALPSIVRSQPSSPWGFTHPTDQPSDFRIWVHWFASDLRLHCELASMLVA
jgi:hypothetical protein